MTAQSALNTTQCKHWKQLAKNSIIHTIVQKVSGWHGWFIENGSYSSLVLCSSGHTLHFDIWAWVGNGRGESGGEGVRGEKGGSVRGEEVRDERAMLMETHRHLNPTP